MADPVVSDTVLIIKELVAPFFTFATAVATIVGGYFLHRQNARQAETAVRVEAVAATVVSTAQKLVEVKKQGEEIHTLVNGNFGISLRLGATSARSLYRADPTEENKKLMDDAEAKFAAHEEREAKIAADKEKARAVTESSYPTE